MNHKQLVEAGYDALAEDYLSSKDENDPATLTALVQLASLTPTAGHVLDLGCGAGVPVTKWLSDQGFALTGVDISARQLELARQHTPNGTFIKADMVTLDFPPETFDAIVSFYSIVHVPRHEQPALLKRIHAWLKPGGAFLATWPISEWEGEEKNWQGWGATMWWSHFDAPTNLNMLRTAGFSIVSASQVHTNNETWLWALALKPLLA